MSVISEYYYQAELSLAAYADLNRDMMPEVYVAALKVAGMSQAQATTFATQYTVIDQYNGTMEKTYTDEFGQEYTYLIDTGLSVTLFEDGSGKQMVAIRGTELSDPDDVITDVIDIGLLGTAKFQDQYEALSAQIQRWKDDPDINLQSGFTVTGHSLGGFLATNLAMEYSADIDHTYIYNAPGLDGITGVGSVLDAIADALSPDRQFAVPSTLSITSFVGSGDMVSSVGEYVVSPNFIFVEGQNPLSAHSMAPLTDSLAVYNMLDTIDNSLTFEAITGILKTNSESYQADLTLEKTVSQLADILVPTMYYSGCHLYFRIGASNTITDLSFH